MCCPSTWASPPPPLPSLAPCSLRPPSSPSPGRALDQQFSRHSPLLDAAFWLCCDASACLPGSRFHPEGRPGSTVGLTFSAVVFTKWCSGTMCAAKHGGQVPGRYLWGDPPYRLVERFEKMLQKVLREDDQSQQPLQVRIPDPERYRVMLFPDFLVRCLMCTAAVAVINYPQRRSRSSSSAQHYLRPARPSGNRSRTPQTQPQSV